MKKFTVAHIGNFDICANRYIDLFEKEEIKKIKIFINENKYYQIDDIKLGLKLYGKQNISKKIKIFTYKNTFVDKIYFKYLQRYNKYSFFFFKKILIFKLKVLLKRNLSTDDIVWIGENDYDNHNLIHCSIKKYLVNNVVIKNYKETRFSYKFFEKESIQNSNSIIFPHKYYLDFFKKIYGKNIFQNIRLYFSDQDQRSKYHYEWIKSIKLKKYSLIDKKIHIAIVVGQVASESCNRSGDRYVIFDSILKLLGCGYVIHLFVKNVIKSRTDPTILHESIYHELASKNKNFILSFEPMNIGSKIYNKIVRCDYGYLHDDVEKSNIPLFEFQKLNIPNRYYEYLVTNLYPISLKQKTFSYQNILVKENGFLLNNIYDLGSVKLDNVPKNSFYNSFPNVFLKAVSECSSYN